METTPSEGNDNVLPSVEDQSHSSPLDVPDYDLSPSDEEFLAEINLDPWCNRREVRLRSMIALLRRRQGDIRRIHTERLMNLNDQVNEVLQGCTCEAQRLWSGGRL